LNQVQFTIFKNTKANLIQLILNTRQFSLSNHLLESIKKLALNYTGIVISRVNVEHSPNYKYGDLGERIESNGKRIETQVYVDVRGLNKLNPGDLVYIPLEDVSDEVNIGSTNMYVEDLIKTRKLLILNYGHDGFR